MLLQMTLFHSISRMSDAPLYIYMCHSSYLLIPFSYLTPPTNPLPTGNQFSVLYICSCFVIVIVCSFFRFHIEGPMYITVFLCLASFTKHNTFQVHLGCCRWQNFILFHGWVIVQCVWFLIMIYIQENVCYLGKGWGQWEEPPNSHLLSQAPTTASMRHWGDNSWRR